MADTYLNTDIFFLDKDLNVIEIERNMKAHPGRETPPQIQISKALVCRHILEMRTNSEISNIVEKGMKLRWASKPSLTDIIQTHSRP